MTSDSPPALNSRSPSAGQAEGDQTNVLLGRQPELESSGEVRQRAAEELDERINQSLGDAFTLLAEAFSTGAWLTLGYESWSAYLATKVDTATLRIPAASRPEIFGRFRQAGMSNREIAAAVGVSSRTVDRALPAPAATNVADVDLAGQRNKKEEILDCDCGECSRPTSPTPLDVKPEPDFYAGHPDLEINAEIERLNRRGYARNVRDVFLKITQAQARFDIDRIAEVLIAEYDMGELVAGDIEESRKWFDRIEQAIAAQTAAMDNVRPFRRPAR